MTRGLTAPPVDQRQFTARYASLSATSDFAHDFCRRHGIDRTRELKLTLILEELVTNTIEHGYGAETDAAVSVALATTPGSLRVLYEDAAPPFDPLAHRADTAAAVLEPFDSRPIGGLGIPLVGGLASEARYEYEAGRNKLWLTLEPAR
ncbi:MAG: ATP-binding protein [Caldimonas sp.]